MPGVVSRGDERPLLRTLLLPTAEPMTSLDRKERASECVDLERLLSVSKTAENLLFPRWRRKEKAEGNFNAADLDTHSSSSPFRTRDVWSYSSTYLEHHAGYKYGY